MEPNISLKSLFIVYLQIWIIIIIFEKNDKEQKLFLKSFFLKMSGLC